MLQKDVKLNKGHNRLIITKLYMKVWSLQPFFKCVKKKNQTAFQTPECNPKEDNNAFNSVVNKTELSAQITNIILKRNKTKDVNIYKV